MKRINSYFKPCFTGNEISEKNLLYFTEDHINALSRKNLDGKYDGLCEETSRIYNELVYAINRNNEVAKDKAGKCSSLNEILEDMKESIRQLEGFVRSISSKQSSIYLELFPEGLSEYCRMNKSNAESLMTRIRVYLKKDPSLNINGIGTRINQLYTNFQLIRREQKNVKEVFTNHRTNRKHLLKELCCQLQINLYTLAIDNMGQPKMAAEFFNERLLNCKRFERNKMIIVE